MIPAVIAVALLAVAGMQVPNAALALNPQPEVPSKSNTDGCTRSKMEKRICQATLQDL
jgi:hypothetical protein